MNRHTSHLTIGRKDLIKGCNPCSTVWWQLISQDTVLPYGQELLQDYVEACEYDLYLYASRKHAQHMMMCSFMYHAIHAHVLINRFRLPKDQCLFLKVNIAIIINGVSYDYYLNSCYLNEKCVYLCPCLHLYSCLSISAFYNNLVIDINLLIGLYSAQYHFLLTYLWLQILLPVLANWCDVAVFLLARLSPKENILLTSRVILPTIAAGFTQLTWSIGSCDTERSPSCCGQTTKAFQHSLLHCLVVFIMYTIPSLTSLYNC